MQKNNPSLTARMLPWAALLLPSLFWAGNFIAGRAMRDALTPMTLALGRWLIALACLLPFAWRGLRRDARRYLAHRWLILGTAVTGVAAFSSLVYIGLHTTTASNGLLLNALIPLLIVLLGALFYRQGLSAGQGVGLVLSFAGVLTLVLQGQWTQWRQVTLVPGDGILLVAMVSFALYTLWLRQLPTELDRLGLTAAQIAIAIIVLLPFWVVEHAGGARSVWTLASGAALVYVGLFPSVGAYLLYMRAVQHFGPARAGLSIHLIPVFGVVLSALVLHERLHTWHAAGIAAIAAGLVCSNVGAGPRAATPTRRQSQSR